jgi:hypothetical protein
LIFNFALQSNLNAMKQHLKDLSEIRTMMERSSRFISLSGLSGIFAGSFALIGAYFAYAKLTGFMKDMPIQSISLNTPIAKFLIIDFSLVLGLSILFSIYFTVIKAKKNGQKIWDPASKRLIISVAIPLLTGGLFSLILLKHAPQLIDSATLVFYGLALINASKYTFDNVKYLGYVQIILGLACGFVNEWHFGLLFWALGFGVGHILYGIIMYREQKG